MIIVLEVFRGELINNSDAKAASRQRRRDTGEKAESDTTTILGNGVENGTRDDRIAASELFRR